MTKPWRVTILVIGALLLVVLLVPFLVPIPELQGTKPVAELADPESLFVTVDGLDVHYKTQGHGQPALLLLHGFASSVFSWREVMAPFARIGTVVAFDRPSSGLTERPLEGEWEGTNPYSREAQADLTVALMDSLGIDEAVLVGNSAGGTIAALTALRHPQRVAALILVDPAIYEEGGAPSWLLPILRSPPIRRIGPLVARMIRSQGQRLLGMAWHDPAPITDEVKRGYEAGFLADNWDKALWELTLASRPLDLPDRLRELTLPTLVITGDDDRIVPTELSVRLAAELPNAKLAVLENCGHVPQEECPREFLEVVEEFLSGLRRPDEGVSAKGET